MNADRRKRINAAIDLLEKAKTAFEEAISLINDVRDEESDSYDSLSEGLQASERGERMNEVVNELINIDGELDIDLNYIISRLDECKA